MRFGPEHDDGTVFIRRTDGSNFSLLSFNTNFYGLIVQSSKGGYYFTDDTDDAGNTDVTDTDYPGKRHALDGGQWRNLQWVSLDVSGGVAALYSGAVPTRATA